MTNMDGSTPIELAEISLQGVPFVKKDEGIEGSGKSLLLEKESGNFEYRNAPLFLGTLFHTLLQQALENDETMTPDRLMQKSADGVFVMDGLHKRYEALGVSGDVYQPMAEAAILMAKNIKEQNPAGFESAIWFTEVPFLPSHEQLKIIYELPQHHSRVDGIASAYGEKDFNQLLRHMITDPHFILKNETTTKTLTDLLGEAALLRTDPIDMKDLNDDQLLARTVSAVSSYYYFNFSAMKDLDIDTMPAELRHVIGTVSARADAVGLSAQTGDTNASTLIERFKTEMTGTYFGQQALHDLTMLGEERRVLIQDILTRIRKGTIALTMVEMKGMFQDARQIGDNQFRPTAFEPAQVSEHHLKDVAHTLFSMYQLAARLVNLKMGSQVAEDNLPFDAEDDALVAAMHVERNTPFGDTIGLYRHLIHFGNTLMNPPNQQILARLYWPIYHPQSAAESPFYGLQIGEKLDSENMPLRPAFAVNLLNSHAVRRAVARVGKRFYQHLIEMKMPET